METMVHHLLCFWKGHSWSFAMKCIALAALSLGHSLTVTASCCGLSTLLAGALSAIQKRLAASSAKFAC